VAFSPNAEMGLTDIEMANGCFDYDDAFEDDRAFDMEYEVGLIQFHYSYV
jgi:hypothetical protein